MDINNEKRSKAQVFVLLGQSNAVGHGVPMCEQDKIKKPLKNVFGLKRQFNQSFSNSFLVWSGYTSAEMNLGETQDNTYSVANCLARQWQDRIDQGDNLPELYIIHIAIGGQGVTDNYMWYPWKEKRLMPGPLGVADISLFSFTKHILSLVKKSFDEMGRKYEIMGIHWRGGEQEVEVDISILERNLKYIYDELLEGFENSLKDDAVPIFLHKIVFSDRLVLDSPSGEKLERMNYINNTFKNISEERKNVKIFDVTDFPGYNSHIAGKNLFIDDLVHYTPEVNKWVANRIIENYKGCNGDLV